MLLEFAALPRVKSDTEKEVVWMDYKHGTTCGTLITWMLLFGHNDFDSTVLGSWGETIGSR